MSLRDSNRVVAALAAWILTVTAATAETIHVCWDGSEDYVTIQEGIDAASGGDAIVICDGTYTGAGNRDLDFGGKAIIVRSENGSEGCIIDCEGDPNDWRCGLNFHSGETTNAILDGLQLPALGQARSSIARTRAVRRP